MTENSAGIATMPFHIMWKRPYADDEQHLMVGPFYAGLIQAHPESGWWIINAMDGKADWRASEAEAKAVLLASLIERST